MGILYPKSNLTFDLSFKVKQVGQKSSYYQKSPITPQILQIESQSVLGLDRKVGMGILSPKSNLTCHLPSRSNRQVKGQIINKSPITPQILEIESQSVLGLNRKVGMGILYPKSNLTSHLPSMSNRQVKGQIINKSPQTSQILVIESQSVLILDRKVGMGILYIHVQKVKFDL